MKSLCAKFLPALSALLVSAFLLLTACSAEEYYENGHDGEPVDALAAAIYDGMIIALEDALALAETYSVAEVRVADFVRTFNIIVNPTAARTDAPRFERHERSYLNGIYVEVGQIVSAGDVLASTRYDATDAFRTRHRHAVEELNLIDDEIVLERSRLRSIIEDLRDAVAFAADSDWESYALELSFAELAYDEFVFESRQARERAREAADEMSEILAGEQLVALFDGVVIFVGVEQTMRLDFWWEDHWHNIVAIADPDSLIFVVEPFRFGDLDTEEHGYIVRHGDVLTVTVDRLDYSFDAVVVNDPNVDGGGITRILMPLNPEDIEPILRSVDYDFMAFSRLVFRSQATWHRHSGGVVVPTDAIQWDVNQPYVLLYDDGFIGRALINVGNYTLMDPALGPRQHTHVLYGVEPGQMVMIP